MVIKLKTFIQDGIAYVVLSHHIVVYTEHMHKTVVHATVKNANTGEDSYRNFTPEEYDALETTTFIPK